jgi:hypothetical protein
MQAPKAETPSRLEIILAIAGAVVCLVVTIIIWVGVSAQQPMWPLPGSYFVEFMLISAVVAYLWVSNHPLRISAAWAATGVFSVLVFIGLFSIGLFYIPNVLIFGALAILADVRARQKIGIHLVIYLVAGIAQAVLMFAVA